MGNCDCSLSDFHSCCIVIKQLTGFPGREEHILLSFKATKVCNPGFNSFIYLFKNSSGLVQTYLISGDGT